MLRDCVQCGGSAKQPLAESTYLSANLINSQLAISCRQRRSRTNTLWQFNSLFIECPVDRIKV
ncbi:uncharacterized protein LAESUDRAFT_721887 [Laetiporus sulphureus 93-53]|uniref:Uncharacterized protein n=1 Tax=Laetiporus sulphureus 93-53 TaxID=1314785 RepID=A0A165GLB0_9APHY|nr:uncharacterized protein LAESUDRAFT_721887 [Laetiporus sulphureus 93-53]KZT10507.1 hypothetical protein LAESUDRAFT_721887 [Laetiporus sulphureus 93-53]